MKVYIDYPITKTLNVRKHFTTNEERTTYLRNWLRRNKIDSPCHDYSDYVVEEVEDIEEYGNDFQYWIVGS